MNKPLLFLFFALSVFIVKAQKSTPFGVTFDCATNDTIIFSVDIPGCDSLVLTGTNSASYKIKSCLISIVKDGVIREWNYGNYSTNAGLEMVAHGKDGKPGKVFIEKLVIVPRAGGNEIHISKRFRFYVKS